MKLSFDDRYEQRVLAVQERLQDCEKNADQVLKALNLAGASSFSGKCLSLLSGARIEISGAATNYQR